MDTTLFDDSYDAMDEDGFLGLDDDGFEDDAFNLGGMGLGPLALDGFELDDAFALADDYDLGDALDLDDGFEDAYSAFDDGLGFDLSGDGLAPGAPSPSFAPPAAPRPRDRAPRASTAGAPDPGEVPA